MTFAASNVCLSTGSFVVSLVRMFSQRIHNRRSVPRVYVASQRSAGADVAED